MKFIYLVLSFAIKVKIAHQKMKSFTSPSQTQKKESTSKENIIKHILPTPPTTISPIILQNENLSESGGQSSQKCSMQKLCQIYLQRVVARSPCEFNAKELIQSTNFKHRRVYDLMNILQGCGYVKRISKGKYQSFSFEQAQQTNNEQTNLQETSLSSMSFHVKKLLIQCQDYKPFKDICSEVFELYVSKSVNAKSLKRRIYECCKVLKTLGLAQKRGSGLKWKGIYGQFSVNSMSKQQNKKSRRGRNRIIQRQKKQTQWQKQIIDTVLSKINHENEFNSFIDTLRAEFQLKMNAISVKRQLKYD